MDYLLIGFGSFRVIWDRLWFDLELTLDRFVVDLGSTLLDLEVEVGLI